MSNIVDYCPPNQAKLARGISNDYSPALERRPAEHQYYRTIRPPWWARVTKNTLDVATYHRPELISQRQAEHGSDYCGLFPNNVLAHPGGNVASRG